MVKVDFPDGTSCYYDKLTYENLMIIKRSNYYDRDALIGVDGEVGSGKSVFAMQVAKFLDNNFTIDNIFYDGESLMKAAWKAKPGTALMYDESNESTQGKNALTAKNKKFMDFLLKIRQRNLFLIFVSPYFFQYEKPVSMLRMLCLFHVYQVANPKFDAYTNANTDPWIRGQYGFYSFDTKKKLYVDGHKYLQYIVKPDFVARFTNTYVVDEEGYRKKKYDYSQALDVGNKPEDKKPDEPEKLPRGAIWKWEVIEAFFKEYPSASDTECARVIRSDKSLVSKYRNGRIQVALKGGDYVLEEVLPPIDSYEETRSEE